MTSELEQQFFKAFGIKPFTCCDEGCKTIGFTKNCNLCPYNKRQYPRLDNYIFLKLICILNSTNGVNCTAYESKNISDLKKEILNECMDLSDDNELKSKIQQLFKEEE